MIGNNSDMPLEQIRLNDLAMKRQTNNPENLVVDISLRVEQEIVKSLDKALEDIKHCRTLDQIESVIQTRVDKLDMQIDAISKLVGLLEQGNYSKSAMDSMLAGFMEEKRIFYLVRESVLNLIVTGEDVTIAKILETVEPIVQARRDQLDLNPMRMNMVNVEKN